MNKKMKNLKTLISDIKNDSVGVKKLTAEAGRNIAIQKQEKAASRHGYS